MFKKRERKKSGSECGTDSASDALDGPSKELESIGRVEFTFNTERRKDDSIFISLHADDRNYEEALPSDSVSIPLEGSPPVYEDYETKGPPRSGNIVTEASIEHRSSIPRKGERKGSRPSSSESQLPESHSRESQLSRSSSKESKIIEGTAEPKEVNVQHMSSSSSRDSIVKRQEIVKPKRKSKERSTEKSSVVRQKSVTENNGKPVVKSEEKQVSFTTEEHLLPVAVQQQQTQPGLTKTSSVVSDLDHNSSESERDSEFDFIRNKAEKVTEDVPDERKGLCYEESFEEDLPYVPTTLPLEKSVVVPILPVKQRLQEVR